MLSRRGEAARTVKSLSPDSPTCTITPGLRISWYVPLAVVLLDDLGQELLVVWGADIRDSFVSHCSDVPPFLFVASSKYSSKKM